MPRIEPYDFERPAILLRVLDTLEHAYLASVNAGLDVAIQQQRLRAWHADAEAATARISDGPFADQIAASYRRACRHRADP